MVFMTAFPCDCTVPVLRRTEIAAMALVSAMILGVILGGLVILRVLRRLQVEQALLSGSLIKQEAAVRQAERKSMNKSMAFAQASHDVRTSLAGITGLIEICRGEVPPRSELDHNLVQMNACAMKLLGILNSILDTSKVESGKMQLEEAEFDMARVLEESVDIFHVVGLKKGLEVIWDPCDFSVMKLARVKGDCRRFKQILDNLLGNAIKFTAAGHVVLRAWANKSTVKGSSDASSTFGCPGSDTLHPVLRWLFRSRKTTDGHHQRSDFISVDPDCIEFYFEVDDTGIGIQKERRDSVFENYVQIRESLIEGHQGTGLGLGIVQSYVRLMGGEISIREKEHGQRGTCFRFNIFLKPSSKTHTAFEVKEGTSDQGSGANDRNYPALQSSAAFEESLNLKGVHSLLFVQGDETKRILQRWMEEDLGIKAWIVHHVELLCPTLEKIKHAVSPSSKSDSYDNMESEGFLGSKNEMIQCLPITVRNSSRKSSVGGTSLAVVVVVDLSYGNLMEIYSSLSKLIDRSAHVRRKIACLASVYTSADDLKRFEQLPCDLILKKPLHGSRLYALLRLMQELQKTHEEQQLNYLAERRQLSVRPRATNLEQAVEDGKPLSRMHVLLVEDNQVLRNIMRTMLLRLGATVESAENGSEAVSLIKEALLQATNVEAEIPEEQQTDPKSFPFDMVLMDCEMPVMDGYEATRHIREEEKQYGIHIPIVALTAHAMPEEEEKTRLAGMDLHLTKPLERKELLEAISCVSKFQKTK